MWVPDCTMQWAIDFIEQYKNNPLAECVALIDDEDDKRRLPVFIEPVVFRDHMNQFATESAREVYGEDHWVDILLPKEPTNHDPEGWRGHFLVPPRSEADFPYSFAHFAVITDLRAGNEMRRVSELGGLKVKIRRRDAEEKERRYYEERGLPRHLFASELPDEDFDVIIGNNDNDMDEAYRRTAHLMSEIKRNGIASIKRGLPLPWRIGF
jgi:hypothetical protein